MDDLPENAHCVSIFIEAHFFEINSLLVSVETLCCVLTSNSTLIALDNLKSVNQLILKRIYTLNVNLKVYTPALNNLNALIN